MDWDLDLPSHLALSPSCCPVALPGVCYRRTPAGICAGRTEGFLVPVQSLHLLQPHTTNPASTDLDLSLLIRPVKLRIMWNSSAQSDVMKNILSFFQINFILSQRYVVLICDFLTCFNSSC